MKQLEEEFTLKLKQLRETQNELKNAKNEIANMVEKEDKDKKKKLGEKSSSLYSNIISYCQSVYHIISYAHMHFAIYI